MLGAFLEFGGGIGRRQEDQEAERCEELAGLESRSADPFAKRTIELLTSRGTNSIGGAFRAAAVTAAGSHGDEVGAQEAVNGVVERAALEDQDFVFVAFAKQLLHLVGMRGVFAQQSEDSDFPETEAIGHK